MICPACRHPIPDNLVTCPVCADVRSRAAMRRYQYHPLLKVKAGEGDFILRAIGSERHVQMFGADQAFCGLKIVSQHRRSFITWEPQPVTRICVACRAEIDELMKEAEGCRSSAL